MALPTIFEYLGSTEEEFRELEASKHNYFVNYSIKKSDGKRVRYINAPKGRYKELLDNILHRFLYKFQCHSVAHGFVKHRSPKTNAQMHLGAHTLVKMDIRNFFNSITLDGVIKLIYKLCAAKHVAGKLFSIPTNHDAELLAKFVCIYNGLPQGASTSPALSNLYMTGADHRLQKFATTNNLTVTRYADDITFSSKTAISAKTVNDIQLITRTTLNTKKLEIQRVKTKVKTSRNRLSVTGIVVNKVLNVDREFYMNLRAAVHNYATGKTNLDETELQSLKGKIAWVDQLNPNKGKLLKLKLSSRKS